MAGRRRYDEERVEARRLVEEDGLSLAAAARTVGVDEKTVRVWQKTDEDRGAGWAFKGSAAEAKARADAVPAEERKDQSAAARRATRARWADRRQDEADYQGGLAGGMRITSAEALTACRMAIAARDADNTVKWARALRDLAVTGGIHADKADKLADISSAASVVAVGMDDVNYQQDMAEVLSLVDRLERERRSG